MLTRRDVIVDPRFNRKMGSPRGSLATLNGSAAPSAADLRVGYSEFRDGGC